MAVLQSVVGIVALLGIAWACSENRSAVALKPVVVNLTLTFALAALLLKVTPLRAAFASANTVVDAIAGATRAGTSFVFGYIGGGPLPFEMKSPGADFVLAIQDRKSTRLNSSHIQKSRMPSSA